MKSFNVIKERDGRFEPYDIMPYLIDCYKEKRKSKRPVSFDDFKEFIKKEGMYMWWSRCEYEVILSDWPSQKTKKKVDIWWQIEMNLDLITEILMDNVKKAKKDKAGE